MRTADLLADALTRIREVVHEATDNLTAEQLEYRPGPEANSITWLIWHLTRVQDDPVAEVAGTEQGWTAEGWAGRLGLPFDDAATGWSHTPDEVAAARVRPAELLTAYHDAVYERSLRYVHTLTDADLDR